MIVSSASRQALLLRLRGPIPVITALVAAALSICCSAPRAAGQDAAGTLTAPMSVYWKFTGSPTPNNPAAPVVTSDAAYISAGNHLYAVDLQSGALRWRYPTEGAIQTVIQATPVYSDGSLYFGAGDGLYALDAVTGKQKWPAFHLRNAVVTSPVVLDGSVYFGADDGKFYAVDGSTGKSLLGVWEQNGRPGIPIGGDIVSDFAVGGGDMMYYITADGAMHAVNMKTGVQRWAQRLDADVSKSKPVLHGEWIYLTASNTLSLWRTSTGTMRWNLPLPNESVAPPAVDSDGTAYVITADHAIYAISVEGRGLWRKAAHIDYETYVQPVVTDNLLIVGTGEGAVYAFDKATGALRWNYLVEPTGLTPTTIPVVTNVSSRPVAANGTLYVLTDDGTLTSFRHGAVDTLAPVVTILDPTQGDYLNGRPPFHVAARVEDYGSGIDYSTLQFKLDDAAIPRRAGGPDDLSDKPAYTFDPDNNSIEYTTIENEAGTTNALSDGPHTATVTVKDWKGNQATKSWTFFIDDTLPKRARNRPGNNRPGQGGNRGFGGGLGGAGLGAGGGKGGG